MDEERRTFLYHLPPDTPSIQYTTFPNLLSSLLSQEDNPLNPYTIITNIPESDLNAHDQFHDDVLPGKIDYHPSSQTLILTTARSPQEEVSCTIQGLLFSKTLDMRIRPQIFNRGRTEARGSTRRKSANQSWVPRLRYLPQARGRSVKWPTVVLEIAYAEGSSIAKKVERDVAWWIRESRGDVRLGVGVEISPVTGGIHISAWEPGDRDLDSDSWPEIRRRQRIGIFRGKEQGEPIFDGDELVIPFEYLMLRAPEPEAGEGDLVFTKEELLEMGDQVWAAMETGI